MAQQQNHKSPLAFHQTRTYMGLPQGLQTPHSFQSMRSPKPPIDGVSMISEENDCIYGTNVSLARVMSELIRFV